MCIYIFSIISIWFYLGTNALNFLTKNNNIIKYNKKHQQKMNINKNITYFPAPIAPNI